MHAGTHTDVYFVLRLSVLCGLKTPLCCLKQEHICWFGADTQQAEQTVQKLPAPQAECVRALCVSIILSIYHYGILSKGMYLVLKVQMLNVFKVIAVFVWLLSPLKVRSAF